MKVKKSEIQLLIAVIGVLIVVCTYFLVYSSFNEKSDALEAQNVTLSSQVATLEALDQRKADYIEATGKMQSYITNFENRFPADILPEDSIMMVKTLEDYTRTEVANIAFGSEAILLQRMRQRRLRMQQLPRMQQPMLRQIPQQLPQRRQQVRYLRTVLLMQIPICMRYP